MNSSLGRMGLCPSCSFAREIVSGKGSRFLFCEKSKTDRRFPKYPSQPVSHCHGFAEKQAAGEQVPNTNEMQRIKQEPG
jgi:hypothetical protein